MIWVHHEKQEAEMCGRHVLSNLFVFRSMEDLATVASEMDRVEDMDGENGRVVRHFTGDVVVYRMLSILL